MNRPAKLIGVAGFPQSQRGLSKWGWLIVLVLGAGLMTTVLRLGPHYIDYRIVGGVVERLDASQVHNMSRDKIREHFSKQFRIENFRVPLKEMLTIDRNRERTIIDINYEVREHLFYNIDVVLTFGEKHTFK